MGQSDLLLTGMLTALVLQELALLDDDANVYKLVGPALIKQDPVEAKSNVQKRLEFINGELARLEGQLKGSEEKQLKKQQQVCILAGLLIRTALAAGLW